VVPRRPERLPQHLPDRQRPAAPVRPAPAAAAGRWRRQGLALIDEARAERERLEAELHTGRDRLLELNSGGAGEGQALVEAILEQDDQFALPIYMETLFDAFGIDSEDHSENALILKPSEKMLDASFPLGDDEGVTITYDRAQALSREDMQFLTWEHPMVQGGMDLVLSGSMGNTAVALIKNKALKPGTVLLELLYVSEVVAPRSLQWAATCHRRRCAACSTPTATTWPARGLRNPQRPA
jgi:ATP-dependent helicase HepA